MEKHFTELQDKSMQALLADSKRKKNVPIRTDFVQLQEGGLKKPGPLGALINSSNGRSLDLYLLHRLAASAEPWDTKRDAAVWSRALGLGDDSYGKDAVSRCWAKLAERKLILRERESKQAKITTLHESGTGEAYTAPTGKYFTLPLEYWSDNWYRDLTVPGKATLLVARSLRPGFYLPGRLVKKWYGFSADVLTAGLKDLKKHDLIASEDRIREDYGTAQITFTERHYSLKAPFNKPSKGQMDLSQLLGAPGIFVQERG
ncbi:hypothetical protein LR392_11175 [Arthrobacter sp. AK04]|uniref:hypothetical protein n=1 Tax=Arthrobacter sp. AK04 TaxID=2900048 RepID=UPI001E52539E|nr:hypothetical protein [Arthrobacter sp. AK04]MCD5342781.1 hypothetical protein [Arthrobacter sp. AK04]